jgi:hypothetical protein
VALNHRVGGSIPSRRTEVGYARVTCRGSLEPESIGESADVAALVCSDL